jgi:hypothetical protein
MMKKVGTAKNTYKNKGLYTKYRRKLNSYYTASTFPHSEWRETRSLLCSGNKTVPGPKSQLTTLLHNSSFKSTTNQARNKHKRSEAALAARKSNRKAKRASRRRLYRQLRKCHDRQATYHDTYAVAQDCPSENQTRSERYLAPTQNGKTETDTTKAYKSTVPKCENSHSQLGWWPESFIWPPESDTFDDTKQN